MKHLLVLNVSFKKFNFFTKNFIQIKSFCSNQNLRKTFLYDFHLEHGGKMVPFANHLLPVVYKDQSLIQSHLHTRNNVSLFDVSHMLQTVITGKDSIEFIESLTVADVRSLKQNQSNLTLFTNNEGGIVDDLILTKINQSNLYLVSNAGCADKVKGLLQTKLDEYNKLSKDVSITYLNDKYSLIALQGPKAAEFLSKFVDYDLKEHKFMYSRLTKLQNIDTRITRCGYTGEDGFEISVENYFVIDLVKQLLDVCNNQIKLSGLAARDSLRLEAGLCLYGNDINESTTPVEANLLWVISKKKRETKNATYPGSKLILDQINKLKPVQKKRVGLKSITNSPVARSGTFIMHNDKIVGKITSGSFSPILNQNIAMGYLTSKLTKSGNRVQCKVHKKEYEYEVCKMPFVPQRYYSL